MSLVMLYKFENNDCGRHLYTCPVWHHHTMNLFKFYNLAPSVAPIVTF